MGKGLPYIEIEKSSLHLDALPEKTRDVFLYCADSLPWLTKDAWYLAGGTALALHVGHRQSEDLDFFATIPTFDTVKVERALTYTKKWKTTFGERGTLYGVLGDAKVSFIAYPFFHPAQPLHRFGHINILDPRDTAVMKIIAISQRGTKRDFIDLYWMCINQETLPEILDRVGGQYPGQEDNMHHILKSLTYFTDAEEDAAPRLFFTADWHTVKKYFEREVPRVTRQLL